MKRLDLLKDLSPCRVSGSESEHKSETKGVMFDLINLFYSN